MKFKSIIRTNLVLAGFAAALLLAGSVKAQEITNTEFDGGPNVAPFEQPVVTQAAANAAVANPASAQPEAPLNISPITEQANLVQASVAPTWEAPVLLLCFALLALYALVQAKRVNRFRNRSYLSSARGA